MKKIIIFIIIILINKPIVGQTKKTEFTIGLASRGVPINVELQGNRYHYYNFNYLGDRQFECLSLNFNMSQKICRNIGVQVSNYFRYNYFRDKSNGQNNMAYEKTGKRFKTDHFIDLFYNPTISKNKKWKLKFGCGYGIMNTGTGFNYPRFTDTWDSAGNLIYIDTHDSFMFWAPRFFIGCSYKKFDLTITAHKSKNQYNYTKKTIWLETKIGYTF